MFCALVAFAAAVHGDAPKLAAPAGPTVRGTLVARNGGILDVRDETEATPRRYVLVPPGSTADAKATAFINSLVIGSEVKLVWAPWGGGRMITSLFILAAPGRFGLLAGTVTDKTPDLQDPKSNSFKWIEVQDDQGNKERYSPQWIMSGNPPTGGMDKELLQAMIDRNIGDRVEIRWMKDDHVRVSSMRLLALSPKATAQPGGEGGIVVGRVMQKGKDWVSVKANDGKPERYLPQRVIGEKDQLDRDVLRALATAKVGDPIEIAWFRDGDRRIYSWKPAGKLATTRPAAVRGTTTRP